MRWVLFVLCGLSFGSGMFRRGHLGTVPLHLRDLLWGVQAKRKIPLGPVVRHAGAAMAMVLTFHIAAGTGTRVVTCHAFTSIQKEGALFPQLLPRFAKSHLSKFILPQEASIVKQTWRF